MVYVKLEDEEGQLVLSKRTKATACYLRKQRE